MRSTTRLGAFGVNYSRLRHRCAAISRAHALVAAAAWKKDGFEFLCFAAKTVGCAAKW
jgi:L-cysteine desulfidase